MSHFFSRLQVKQRQTLCHIRTCLDKSVFCCFRLLLPNERGLTSMTQDNLGLTPLHLLCFEGEGPVWILGTLVQRPAFYIEKYGLELIPLSYRENLSC